MPNPWEIAQAPAQTTGKNPWEISGTPQGKPTQLGIQTVQEMHPDITFLERAAIKNFGSDNPFETINYLKSRHPKMDIITGPGGQVIMRNPGEAEYRVLDPSSFDIQDLSDVAYDLLSGTGTGAASALAGLAGGVAGGGLGAIPAAMGAGGVAGTGLEALRQAIGKKIGVTQEYDPLSIAISGGLGAASPLLMGTGASAKQIAKWGVAKETQQGVLRKATDWGFKRSGEALSGVRREVIENMEKKFPQIKKMQTASITDLAEDRANTLADKLREVEYDSWQKFEKSLAGSKEEVDISDVYRTFDNLEKKAQGKIDNYIKNNKGKPPQSYYDDLAAIKAERADVLPQPQKVTGEFLNLDGTPATKIIPPATKFDPVSAADINRKLGIVAEYSRLKPDKTSMTSRLANMSDETKRALALAADKSYRSINAQLEGIAEKEGGLAAKNVYKETVNIHRYTAPYFKDAQTTINTLTSLNRKGRAVLAERLANIDKKFGTKLMSTALDLETVMTFGKPNLLPLSALQSTSTSRTIPAALMGATIGGFAGSQIESGRGTGILGMGLGGAAGAALGGPAAIKQYIKARLLAQRLGAGIRDIPYGMPSTGIPTALYGAGWLGGTNQ